MNDNQRNAIERRIVKRIIHECVRLGYYLSVNDTTHDRNIIDSNDAKAVFHKLSLTGQDWLRVSDRSDVLGLVHFMYGSGFDIIERVTCFDEKLKRAFDEILDWIEGGCDNDDNYYTLRDFAHKSTIATTKISGGGSEMFDKCVDGVYLADLDACSTRIQSKLDNKDEFMREQTRRANAAETRVKELGGALEIAKECINNDPPPLVYQPSNRRIGLKPVQGQDGWFVDDVFGDGRPKDYGSLSTPWRVSYNDFRWILVNPRGMFLRKLDRVGRKRKLEFTTRDAAIEWIGLYPNLANANSRDPVWINEEQTTN